MTSADTDAMMALQDLLDERQRYEGWLAVLDDRKSSTPAHVYDRVHTDYSLRLERVTGRLSERAEQLAGTIDALTSRLNALRARESERTDARHEAELRAAVGEYGSEDWERMRTTADRELDELANERGAVEAEVAELERIVALTRQGVPDDMAADETSSEEPDGLWEETSPAAGGVETQVDGFPRADSTAQWIGDGDLDPGVAEGNPPISDFVAEWPVAQNDAAAESAPEGDGVPEVPEVDGGAAPPAAPSSQPSGNNFVGLPQPASSSTPTARPMPPAGDTRRENEKTLKCPECGVMNYATEWYCERCGGELSTF